MKAKEFFEQVAAHTKRQKHNEEVWEAMLPLDPLRGVNYDGMPHSKNVQIDDQIVAMLYERGQIYEKMREEDREYARELEMVKRLIMAMMEDGHRHLAILKKYYVDLETTKNIADALYLSPSRVRHRRLELLQIADTYL